MMVGSKKKRNVRLVADESVEVVWAAVNILSRIFPHPDGVSIDRVGDFLRHCQEATDVTSMRYVMESNAVNKTCWDDPTIAVALSKAVSADLLCAVNAEGLNRFKHTDESDFDLWALKDTSTPYHEEWRDLFTEN